MDTQNMVPGQPNAPVEPQGSWFGAHKALVYIVTAAIVVAAGVAGYFVMSTQKVNKSDLQPVTHKDDPTANWKTYTNSKGGFSFKYPNDWIEGKGTNEIIASFSSPVTMKRNANDCPEGCGPDIALSYYSDITKEPENYYNKLNATTLDEWIQRNPDVTNAKKITFAGYPAYSMSMNGLGSYYRIMIDKNGKIYSITFENLSTQAALTTDENQILSTFKFTDTASMDTSTWKTYTNSQYGV